MVEIMSNALYFEDVEVGQIWISPSRTVTETDVIAFAQMTGDFNPLHVDQHFAAESIYGRPIAHGLLGLSWAAGLSSQSPNMRTVAFVKVQEWSFLQPIFFGDTVHVRTSVQSKSPGGRRSGRVIWQRRLVNQRGEITQEGTFETLVETRVLVPRPHVRKSLEPAAPSTDLPTGPVE
jgi:acyl dehydratase